MMTTLEFVDYIFDRYTYLEVAPDSPVEVMRQEIRRRRAQNHPDKLHNVSEAIQQAAARTRDLLDDCARVLLDEALRSAYDLKLAEFREATPHLVSTNGTARIDPTRFRIDLDYLLQSTVQNLAELEALAAQMSGHNEQRLDKARARLVRDPLDRDYREDLRDALTRKLSYLSALEDFYWQKAGVAGGTKLNDDLLAASPSHFGEQLERHLEHVAARAGEAILQRNTYASLGFTPVLLLTLDGAETSPSTDAEQLTAQVVSTFQARAEDLRDLIARKSKVIEELIPLSRWTHLSAVRDTDIVDIVLVRTNVPFDDQWPGPDFAQTGFYLRLVRSTQVATPVVHKLTHEELAAWPNELVALETNSEISGLFVEAMALAERLTPGTDQVSRS